MWADRDDLIDGVTDVNALRNNLRGFRRGRSYISARAAFPLSSAAA